MAFEAASAIAEPVGAVRRSLVDAGGRSLADPVLAAVDRPATDLVAMDGWAVAGPPPWHVEGAVGPGDTVVTLRDGAAIAIGTGASMPRGATGTIRTEEGQVVASVLRGRDRGRSDVRPRAEEWQAGEVLVPAGAIATPGVIGLAAAAGHDALSVRDPRVSVVVTGDELTHAGAPTEGRVRDALGPLLVSWLDIEGCRLVGITHVRDDPRAIGSAVEAACAESDLTIVTGATARGGRDFVRPVLRQQGFSLVVDGVRVRPGHPMFLARRRDDFVCGLPGNPLAAVAAFLTMVRPILRTLAGKQPPALAPSGAWSARREPCDDWRLVFVGDDGRPVDFAGSSMLRGLAGAASVHIVPPTALRSERETLAMSLFR